MISSSSCDGIPIEHVADTARLNALCAEWDGEEFLAIDTEFERTSTFYARIGLLQIADSHSCYLLDPLTIDDWSAFKRLLASPSCTLVMHSCNEDLSLLQTFLGCLPVSLFDTQLAAAFLGIGFSISYQGLVEEILDIEVAKDETRSDWIKRPLSDKQIHYAAADVRYLLKLREILSEQLKQKDMESCLQEECEQQLVITRRLEEKSQWELYYIGISNAWRLDTEGLQALQQLCLWREQQARQRNKPRSWIVKDNDLLNLCAVVSRANKEDGLSLELIRNAEAVDKRFLSHNASEIYHLLSDSTHGAKVDPTLLNKPLNAALRNKLKLIKQVATAKAEALGMAPELLARKKFLVELLRVFEKSGELQWPDNFAGWRREFLEAELAPIIAERN